MAQTQKSTFDTVKLVSRYITHSNIVRYEDDTERSKAIHAWLEEYHTEGVTEDRKVYLRECVLMNVFFKFVHILGSRKLSQSVFDDALQNMVLSAMKAIDNFKPELNKRFTNYLVGYVKEAFDITIRESFIVYVPKQSRKRAMKQAISRTNSEQNFPCSKTNYNQSQTETIIPTEQDSQDTQGDIFDCYTEPDYLPGDVGIDSVIAPPVDRTKFPPLSDVVEEHKGVEDRVFQSQMYSYLSEVLSRESDLLTEAELMVITYRHGILSAPQSTLEEVAEMIRAKGNRASKEWVHQLEKRAIKKLKKYFYRHNIRNYSKDPYSGTAQINTQALAAT